MKQATSQTQTIQQLASQCVRCGLCLPACPTYVKSQHEAESARGRIALAAGLASGKLSFTDPLATHLENCLSCRSCEAVCPSNVEYGKLIDQTRHFIAQHYPPATKNRFIQGLEYFILHPRYLIWLRRLLRFYQLSGLRWLAKTIGLDKLSPSLTKIQHWRDFYPPIGVERGRVALFLGCINDLIDQTTLAASIKLLTHFGYGVHVPKQQGCCGALFLHQGNTADHHKLMMQNLQAFNIPNIQAIISIASGCSATLGEYHFTQPQAADFTAKVQDISQFLSQCEIPSTCTFKPLAKRIVIHSPCTMRNVRKQSGSVMQLLKQIPEVTLLEPVYKVNCCGAAGSYFLTKPKMANQLGKDTLISLLQPKPDLIVTTNIGCQLHLHKHTLMAKHTINIVHPITLLAAQLDKN